MSPFSFPKMNLATALVCFAMLTLPLFAAAEESVDVEVKFASSYRVVPKGYQSPYSRQGHEREAKERLYKTMEVTSDRVTLQSEQSLCLSLEQTGFFEANLSVLTAIPDDRLLTLYIACYNVDRDNTRHLKRFSRLKRLSLYCEDASIDGLAEACPQLESLELSSQDSREDNTQGDAFSDETFAKLVKFKHLRALRIEGREISDTALLHLADLKELECVEVMGSRCLTNNAVKTLAKCKGLREVGLTMNRSLTFEGLSPLAELPKLERIWLADGEAFFNTATKELQAKFKHVLIKTKP